MRCFVVNVAVAAAAAGVVVVVVVIVVVVIIVVIVVCLRYRVQDLLHQCFILFGLCVQIVGAHAFFLVQANSEPGHLSCWISVVAVHYFALTMFFWTALEGFSIHRGVAKAFDAPPRHFKSKSMLFAQGER